MLRLHLQLIIFVLNKKIFLRNKNKNVKVTGNLSFLLFFRSSRMYSIRSNPIARSTCRWWMVRCHENVQTSICWDGTFWELFAMFDNVVITGRRCLLVAFPCRKHFHSDTFQQTPLYKQTFKQIVSIHLILIRSSRKLSLVSNLVRKGKDPWHCLSMMIFADKHPFHVELTCLKSF